MKILNTIHETMAEAKSFELAAENASGESLDHLKIMQQHCTDLAQPLMSILEQTQERLSTDARAAFESTRKQYKK